MKITNRSAINVVLAHIQKHVDPKATVSKKSGKPVIHYAVETGAIHAVIKGKEIPHVAFRKMNALEAPRICSDMGWTHDNTEK